MGFKEKARKEMQKAIAGRWEWERAHCVGACRERKGWEIRAMPCWVLVLQSCRRGSLLPALPSALQCPSTEGPMAVCHLGFIYKSVDWLLDF